MQPKEYVGIDLHRRRSVIVRRSAEGETLDVVRDDNDDPLAFEKAVMAAGENPEVVLEACYGWYWAVDLLEELGCQIHLAHPLGNNWGNRRVKNDTRDAEDLADLLRLGRLAEAWIAPPEVRELRELVRYRAKLVGLRTNCKLQVYAVLAKEGVHVPMTDLFGVGGTELLDSCQLAHAYRVRVQSLRDLIELFDREVAMFEGEVVHQLADHAVLPGDPTDPRCRPAVRSGVHGRDRRRYPVPNSGPAGQLGRSHPQAPRVRHHGAPGLDHEAGIAAGALGGRGSGATSGERHETTRRLHTHHRPPRRHRRCPQNRQGRRGPQDRHPRLLRPPRRHHPLEGRRGGGVTRFGHHQTRGRRRSWSPVRRRDRGSD